MFLPEPLRYSEDLDYVRTTAGGIGNVMKRLTALGRELGYKVNTKMSKYPKVISLRDGIYRSILPVGRSATSISLPPSASM